MDRPDSMTIIASGLLQDRIEGVVETLDCFLFIGFYVFEIGRKTDGLRDGHVRLL
jgi:hypothetical protein